MANDEGKRFEEDFSSSFPANVSIDRLYDNMGGLYGVRNICDYIVYSNPNIFYFELKSKLGKSVPLSQISDTQYDGLLAKSELSGVRQALSLILEMKMQN